MAPIAPAVMENKRRLLPLPIELRHEIYGYLSVPGPDNRPTTTLSPFRKSTHVVGKVTTTIVGVCTPSMGLLRMGDCFEAAEYVEWLRNFGHELHVHIAFKAALPAGFSVGLEGWKFKVEKGLEKLATRHRAMKKWPRRVWVDWKPKVHQSTKKDIEIGKIVAGMVKTVLTGGGERIGRRDDRVGVMLYIFTVSNGMLLGARAIFAELMTVGLDGVGWGKVELSLYVDNMFAGQANSDGQIVYPNGMVRFEGDAHLEKLLLTRKIQEKYRGTIEEPVDKVIRAGQMVEIILHGPLQTSQGALLLRELIRQIDPRIGL